MPYLDMVIEETQRMYPAATRLDRVSNQDYEYEGIKMKSIILNNDYININNLSLSNIKNDNMDVCEKKSNTKI